MKRNAIKTAAALMTTTVGAMADTIAALQKETTCKVVVGGAVLTEDYAQEICADGYAANAVAAVNYVDVMESHDLIDNIEKDMMEKYGIDYFLVGSTTTNSSKMNNNKQKETADSFEICCFFFV